ncbi:hypothetical protein KY495_10490 [Massilia sp. PAMC28688]|uniref:hypothetical protein n=1 Tax=Massilia sp. PAMC28688 TaxID=2861283 RepID=UPI001C627101|nr:hypothetical protein [Massilia sp. PAMC28688]QYF95531.1 hypothetical protein KY495_10490 [Massilia sp. PAMC28688]
MMENLIVAVIVGASALYAGRKYLPARLFGKADEGCASGCGACKSGCDTPSEAAPAQGPSRRVIPIRSH